jgi:uncharacterized protein YecE (DUF72 family)
MTARPWIGCSSWTSEAWWGKVYPVGLPPGERLAVYARSFDAVEVDASYYRDPGPFLVRRWAKATPDAFRFTMKFPRDLLDPKRPPDREAIAAFESHARELGPKLGAIVAQFPPWATPGRAAGFLDELLDALDPGICYAVELRDARWFDAAHFPSLRRALEAHHVALVWSYLTYLDVPPERTGDVLYLRFIGDHTTVPAEQHGELRVDRAEPTRLWAERWKAAQDRVENAFAFFNNHFAGFAPASVNLFREELGLPPVRYELPPSPAPEPAPSGGRQTTLGER